MEIFGFPKINGGQDKERVSDEARNNN